MSGLRLQLLNGFALQTAEAHIELPLGMQRLLAFVALHGPSDRHVVAGSLWPEVSEAHALARLRTSMWRTNRLTPGLLDADGARVAMAMTTKVDSHDQERFATRLLREHVDDQQWIHDGLPSLWWGELLPGWYDDWVVFERERLNQLRLHALEQTAAVLTRSGHLDTAFQLALEAVRIEPLRESAAAVLMRVHLAQGNVCDAIHQYEVFRDLLQRELGLDPTSELARLLPQARHPMTHS